MICERLFRRVERYVADQNATGAVEFAFLSPLLILAGFLTIDLGLGGYSQMQVQNAAQAGAEFALYNYAYSTFSNQNIITAVTSATSNSGISASPSPVQFYACATDDGLMVVSSGWTCYNGATAGTYVSVYATTTYKPIISYFGVSNSYVLHGQATVRVQ